MKFEKWLFLPFLGGSGGDDGGPGSHHAMREGDGRQMAQDAGIPSKHESAKDFRNKGEEDIVQDYNAPIRWWVIATL